MTADLLLAIDQGTTSTRAIAFDRRLQPVAAASVPLDTVHPRPGWVEQDPSAILDSVIEAVGRVLDDVGGRSRIQATGLDNQGETVVAWEADACRPIGPAIVWQCRRSLPIVERLRQQGREPTIRARTGLPLDPYFSAGKMAWLLEHDPEVQRAADAGTLRLGTVDAWLTARLGGGARTDPSTASRTQLFALPSLDWDDDVAASFGVERWMLPAVVPSAGELGHLRHDRWHGELPLHAMVCDQQAALAGHGAFQPGTVKATYGTGVFVLANAGGRRHGAGTLERSIAWTLPDGTVDAVIQGGWFTAGAFIDWLRDDLRLIADASDTAGMARDVPDTAGVRILPALSGLGPPWWRPGATATIVGMTAAAQREHLVRAALDGIAHGVTDLLDAVAEELDEPVRRLRVDGGLTANAYLMQAQADLAGVAIDLAESEESTALGTAALAGIGAGVLDASAVATANPVRSTWHPRLEEHERRAERDAWRAFVVSVT